MDIQKIKYNQELIKNKIRLQKELNMVEKELDKSQQSCDHIRICLGWNGPYQYRDTSIFKCLLCSEREPESHYNVVDATNYKKFQYSHGEFIDDRKKRFSELQELAMNMIIENPSITEEELVKKLNDLIKEDEAKSKDIEKKLGRKFI